MTRFQPAAVAGALVNGKAHAVPLAVSNRGKWFDQRTDRNCNVRRAPIDRDYRFASCIQQEIGRLGVRRENGYGEYDRQPLRDLIMRASESMPYRHGASS
jgi:hypothetical protein